MKFYLFFKIAFCYIQTNHSGNHKCYDGGHDGDHRGDDRRGDGHRGDGRHDDARRDGRHGDGHRGDDRHAHDNNHAYKNVFPMDFRST